MEVCAIVCWVSLHFLVIEVIPGEETTRRLKKYDFDPLYPTYNPSRGRRESQGTIPLSLVSRLYLFYHTKPNYSVANYSEANYQRSELSAKRITAERIISEAN